MAALVTEALADVIAICHAFVMIVYVGGAVSLLRGGFFTPRLRLWQRFYLGIVLVTSLSILFADRCCLTELENALRAINSPEARYDCTYVGHYLSFVPDIVETFVSLLLLLAGCGATICTVAARRQL